MTSTDTKATPPEQEIQKKTKVSLLGMKSVWIFKLFFRVPFTRQHLVIVELNMQEKCKANKRRDNRLIAM